MCVTVFTHKHVYNSDSNWDVNAWGRTDCVGYGLGPTSGKVRSPSYSLQPSDTLHLRAGFPDSVPVGNVLSIT